MLGRGHEQKLIEDLWETTEEKTRLPYPLSVSFLEARGPMGIFYDNKRSYQRFFMRGKAVLKLRGKRLGAFTKDVSRQGVGFLSPVQLMPMERIQLTLPSAEVHVQVSRCRRLDKACFDCGARFAL